MNHYAFPNVWLTTLDAVKLHRGLNEKNIPQESRYSEGEIDAILAQCILNASASIVDELQRLPLPHRKSIVLAGGYSRTLYVDDDLLDVLSVTSASGTLVDPTLYSLSPFNRYPKQDVVLSPNASYPFWWSSNRADSGVSIDGIWGYVPHWENAWKSSGQTVPLAGISASATTITVVASSVFEIGAYIRVDSEYMQVVGRNTITHTLTLERGVLGTTPASHDAGVAMSIFVQHADIATKATEWAAFLYKSLDQLGEEVQVFEGVVQYVKGLSPLIKRALRAHRRL